MLKKQAAVELMKHLVTHDWHGYSQISRWGDGEGKCNVPTEAGTYQVEQGDRDIMRRRYVYREHAAADVCHREFSMAFDVLRLYRTGGGYLPERGLPHGHVFIRRAGSSDGVQYQRKRGH